jgi:DNA-binding transcriptional regulator GbsR (MarR family)
MSGIVAQHRPSKEPKGAASNGGLSALEAEAIGLFVQLGRMVGQPRSFAEVYGLLFISTRPMTIEDLIERLGASKAAADRALRFLRKAGALRIVYVPGDRRMHFEAVAEPRHMVIGFVRDQILPQLTNSESRINQLAEVVHKLPAEQRAKLSSRVAMLQRWGKKSRNLGPVVLKMLEH